MTTIRSASKPLVSLANKEPTLVGESSLFRPEVVSEQQTKWLGTVLLTPSISHSIFAIFAGLVILSLLALLFFGDYTRKARINGWLVPETGLIRVFTPESSRIGQLHVQEGADVKKGDPLVLLSTEVESQALGATRQEIIRQLASRRDSMTMERGRAGQLYDYQTAELSARMTTIQSEGDQLQQELVLQRERLGLAEAATARQRQLRERGLATEQTLQEAESDRLDQALRLRALERSSMTTERERLKAEAELRAIPLKHATQLAEIERVIASLGQEIAEAEARRQILVTAPEAGIVTAIHGTLGSTVSANAPLLSIVPADSMLEAELYSPSSAIGFVQVGQKVLLRYQAFPYQKFGTYEGTVVSVSRSAISPSELAPQLSSLTGLYGMDEPVYRITVALAKQTAVAYGEPVALQPGMQLEADVIIDSRRLIEWVLDPLFTLTGRWGA